MIIINLMKKTTNNEITDFITAESRLKGTKHFERRRMVKWFWAIVIFLALAFIFSFLYANKISAEKTTAQERITRYQIANHIPQRHYQITFTN